LQAEQGLTVYIYYAVIASGCINVQYSNSSSYSIFKVIILLILETDQRPL